MIHPDPREFADAILELLKDDERCREIGQNAYEVILEEYSWEAIARRHLEFYEQFM